MAKRKSPAEYEIEDATRQFLISSRLRGNSLRRAAKEANVSYDKAIAIYQSEESTLLIETLTKRRRADLTSLFDQCVDSLVEDMAVLETVPLDNEGRNLSWRQSLRAEVQDFLKLCDPNSTNPVALQPQPANGQQHITYQTLVQIAMANSPKSTSNGHAPSPDPSIGKSQPLLT